MINPLFDQQSSNVKQLFLIYILPLQNYEREPFFKIMTELGPNWGLQHQKRVEKNLNF